MAHQLEVTADGTASFAYNRKGGHPWHKLGTQLDGLQDVDTMLREARADYDIQTFPVYMQGPAGMIEVPGQFATARPHPHAGQAILDSDGQPTTAITADGVGPAVYPEFQSLGIVSGRYEITGHRALMMVALSIVEAGDDQARCVDTMGVLEDGRRFFAYVRNEEPVILDPNGIAEKHEAGLGVHTRHDGVGATRFFHSLIRIVCNNTVTAAENTAKAVYTLPHKVEITDRVAIAGQARIALGIANEATTEYLRTAEKLLRVPMNAGTFRQIVHTIWPDKDDVTDRARKIKATRDEAMVSLFEGERNAGSAGFNGHAAVQAIGEFMDHHRRAGRGGEKARAMSALGLRSTYVGKSNVDVKELATQVVLDRAGVTV